MLNPTFTEVECKAYLSGLTEPIYGITVCEFFGGRALSMYYGHEIHRKLEKYHCNPCLVKQDAKIICGYLSEFFGRPIGHNGERFYVIQKRVLNIAKFKIQPSWWDLLLINLGFRKRAPFDHNEWLDRQFG